MKKIFKSLLIALTILCLSSVTLGASLTGSGTIDDYTFTKKAYSQSRDRTYKVYTPANYNSSVSYPMIMVLHGCAMDNVDALNGWNLDLIADQQGIVLVFPFITTYDGMRSENCWGYWFDHHIHEGEGEAADLYNLAKEVETNYNIDATRRYVTGISSGGAMTHIQAVAYSEYWAAAAPISALPYGDGSTSVTSDQFLNDYTYFRDKIQTEIGSETHQVPLLVMQSMNDTVVRLTAGELIRDSHLSAYGADLVQDGNDEDCSFENITCPIKTYKDSDGKVLVKTAYYDGQINVGERTGQYGEGHYYVGEDDGNAWLWSIGPKSATVIWDFFSEITFDGGNPTCDSDTVAPAPATGLSVVEIDGVDVTLSVNANTEEDLRGYKIYKSNGAALTGVQPSTNIILTGLDAETTYTVYVVAVDDCGNESTVSSNIEFTTGASGFVFETVSGTCTAHYIAGRLGVTEYIACGSEFGYLASVTLWKLPDGTWSSTDPDGSVHPCEPYPACLEPIEEGVWTTEPNLDGMEVHLYKPTSTTSNGKRALMISLHGCSQSNEVVRDNWSWQDEADYFGMVIAAPMAPDGGVIVGCWDYYDSNHSSSNPSRHDDNLVALTERLIADTTFNIDPDQVYISGLSSGGGETFIMGCLRPDLFAGIGINAGPALGTTSGQIGSVATTSAATASLCNTFAGTQSAKFGDQITSIVHGTSDQLVAPGYARVDAEAMAIRYGVSKDAETTTVAIGGTITTWSDVEGQRIQEIMVSGMDHSWPAGNDSSGGGYTNHNTVDYPAILTQWLFDNNRRANFDTEDDVTAPVAPVGLVVTGQTDTTISISWTANTETDLKDYVVYGADVIDGVYTALDTTATNGYVSTGLTAESTYYFKVTAKDVTGNESDASSIVTGTTDEVGGEVDTVAPVITLLGTTPVTITVGDSYTDAGATASDDVDGNITASIAVTGSVNTGTVGSYTINYNVSDAAGNPATQVQRVVNVEAATVECYTGANSIHAAAGRATVEWSVNYYATGSHDYLGLMYMTTSVQKNGSDWDKVTYCP